MGRYNEILRQIDHDTCDPIFWAARDGTLCTPASRAAGEKWEAEAAARAKQAKQEAAEKHRREVLSEKTVGEPGPDPELDPAPAFAELQDEPPEREASMEDQE